MSRSLDDEDSSDGWGDWELPTGLGFLLVLGVVGVLAVLVCSLGKPSYVPAPGVRTVGIYGEP